MFKNRIKKGGLFIPPLPTNNLPLQDNLWEFSNHYIELMPHNKPLNRLYYLFYHMPKHFQRINFPLFRSSYILRVQIPYRRDISKNLIVRQGKIQM